MTYSDVIGFDTNDIGKHCPAIELGFSVDTGKSGKFGGKFYVFVQFCTVECQLQGEESRLRDRDMLGVRTDAKSVLKVMCKKLHQKTPVTYPVARALSCLDPRNMAGSPEQCKTMMRCLLSVCVESGFVVEADCDEACNSLMTSSTRVQMVNCKTFLLPMTALPEWQLTILRYGQFVSSYHLNRPQ